MGEAGDVDEAIAGIRGSDPDVVLLDVHMPGGGGLAVTPGDWTSPSRPSSHVSAVLRKLQLSSRYELTTWASARRLI